MINHECWNGSIDYTTKWITQCFPKATDFFQKQFHKVVWIVDKDDDTTNVADTTNIAQVPLNNVSNSGELIAPNIPEGKQLTE